ncbi:carboxypeptidase-like regulatory domain-containing protein [Kordia algicida OT-1]|uniref:Carboxypeptidase-like regulatory domain-containing protein n=1 Tax=Kordia algicida OT-1 TaxID=391587 RepID=A9DYF9_9FLAO|nr:carboxypeptidase-like regulatory domain-containing protein [Kordia algicida]EDP96127.1 hypothetical protein KAOT1_08158 [Kordia algicida OT-1]
MKKSYLLLIISLIISEISAQTISNGMYFVQKKDIGFQVEVFEFYGTDKFAYVDSGCQGTSFGKGSYQITDDDSLVLTFESDYTSKLHKDYHIQTNASDNLEIDLTIIDEEVPLPGVSVLIKEQNKEFIGDFDGNVNTIINKPTSQITLEIRYVGYHPIEISIPKEASKVSGKISFGYLNSIPKNEKMSFKILKIKNSRITFESVTRSRTFKKVNQWQLARKVKKHMPDFYEKMYADFF